jgi:hypothetical protein
MSTNEDGSSKTQESGRSCCGAGDNFPKLDKQDALALNNLNLNEWAGKSAFNGVNVIKLLTFLLLRVLQNICGQAVEEGNRGTMACVVVSESLARPT